MSTRPFPQLPPIPRSRGPLQVGNQRQRPVPAAAPAAAPAPWQPAAAPKPEGLTAEFLKQPITFMRTHAVSPPHEFTANWGAAEFGTMGQSIEAHGSNFNNGDEQDITPRTGAGGVRPVQFLPHPHKDFPSAVSFKAAPPAGKRAGYWLPIYWLPWKSLNIVTCQIPAVPSNLVDPDDEDYPRFFFTAGINGCSVFASGDSRSPTITHAGLDANLAKGVTAGQFWRNQMNAVGMNQSLHKIKGEVNSGHYMLRGWAPTELMRRYQQFLQGQARGFPTRTPESLRLRLRHSLRPPMDTVSSAIRDLSENTPL